MGTHPGGLAEALAERVDGEVRLGAGSGGAYAADASNCRQVPPGVLAPRSIDAAVTALAVCRDLGAPGAGGHPSRVGIAQAGVSLVCRA